MVTFAHGQAVVLSADGAAVSGINLDDRTTTWSRELRSGLSHPTVPLAGRRLALPSQKGIEVIGTDRGDTIAHRHLGLSPRHRIEVVGTTLVLHAPGDRPEVADQGARSSVLLLDLVDPDVSPRHIDGVTSVVTLRSPAPVEAPRGTNARSRGSSSPPSPRIRSTSRCWTPVAPSGSRVTPACPAKHVAGSPSPAATPDRSPCCLLGEDAAFVVAHGRGGVGHDLWLVADEARAGVTGDAQVVTVDPVPVIQTAEG